MEISDEMRQEAVDFVSEIYEEASKINSDNLYFGGAGVVGDTEFELAKQSPEGAITYLTDKRFELIQGCKSPISKAWVSQLNFCDFLTVVDYVIGLYIKKFEFDKENPSFVSTYLEELKRNTIDFFIDYANIVRCDRYIKAVSGKTLPEGLFNHSPKAEIEFIRVEGLLQKEGYLDDKYRWTGEGNKSDLQYLLKVLCQNNIFNKLSPADYKGHSWERLRSILDYWEVGKVWESDGISSDETIENFIKEYLKASKFKVADRRSEEYPRQGMFEHYNIKLIR